MSVKMASDAEKQSKGGEKVKKLTQEQIISTFNQLRQDQKNLVTKLTEVEQELNEHSLVVDTLKDVDQDRVCYRMIGGVLVERTVKEVLPAVSHNKEQLAVFLENLNQQIEKKGREINEFKEKYNIQIRKEAPFPMLEPMKDESEASSSGVLVKTES
ncbi:prefoldin subunit 2-like [Stegodyphus dumicola]|uniref:prefoldin subunit 2-like n=1 Tax=Stegodyphus dumicola TaxID=202533 RepID=UPI0015B25388|nr:prefoldin subunit 2-like [Stegodyphus dumicola]